MRKITTIISAIAIVGMFAVACNSTTPGDEVSNVADEVDISDLKVAYIVTDSVINNFVYFKEKSAEIAEKGKKYEGELTNRARGFEQEVQNFQSSASSMTINQARAKEEELVTKERNLVAFRENIMQELSADETKLYNDVYDMIQEYLDSYAAENDLEMILSYTRGGGVWYANKSLDITDSVVKGINEDYRNSEEPAAAEPTAAESTESEEE
ncbi:OmpH family outer membrane protein [Cyclobacterium jeungdonense]|uniref:OmpH family outer membrane protein n=1 Tax=Cyclobacterium jeungdonense TaxID=708087 RepID=A0ABT8CDE4_9BACT|nr:OmpH family outer membrane protein [Cyclobacterium jeungdonense]MDN3690560.1 OmpH family outer membrane protein [Cyclobacterium jeungdonense]